MKKVIYSKFSNERAAEFSIRTDIIEDDGKKYVVKTPDTEKARNHVLRMKEIYEQLRKLSKKKDFLFVTCKEQEESVCFEYVEGVSLEEDLDKHLMSGKIDEVEKILLEYCSQVREMFSQKAFFVTEEFQRIFGEVNLPQNLLTSEVNDIDMVVGNVILNDDKKYIIDYEWSFMFPIPVSFIIYRILHYYLYANDIRKELRERNLFEKSGIGKEELPIYDNMERNFQKYIVGNHVPIRNMYEEISPGSYPVMVWANKEQEYSQKNVVQVFFSLGDGYFEENSKYFPMKNNDIQLELEIPAGTTNIRIDPGSDYSLCKITKLCFDTSEKMIEEYHTNGYKVENNQVILNETDPQLTLDSIQENARKVLIELSVDNLEKAQIELWTKMIESKRQLENEFVDIKEQKNQIEEQKIR